MDWRMNEEEYVCVNLSKDHGLPRKYTIIRLRHELNKNFHSSINYKSYLQYFLTFEIL